MRECLTIPHLCKLLINLIFDRRDIRILAELWGRAGCGPALPEARSPHCCAFGLPRAPRMCDRGGALGESEGA